MVRPILLRKHRLYSFSGFSFPLKFKTNVPVKLKLQHPPWAYPAHYLTVILARGGGGGFERCLERVGNLNQIYLLF